MVRKDEKSLHFPSISVVMPVRNAMPYLDAAIESIIGQTHRDFEFVILDDGSEDGSLERLRWWAARDSRIRLIEGGEGRGPVGSSNFVVSQSRAPIVARMDADDVAMPDRLQCQLAVLARHPDTVLVGSVWEGIDRQGRVVREPALSGLDSRGFAAPFAHGSIMFRRQAFEAAGGYRNACRFWEDLDLYVRMADQGRVLVIPRSLYQHRFSETSTRLTSRQREVEEAVDLMFRCREAFEREGDYAPLLEGHRTPNSSRKLHPYTFVSLGCIPLWSGLRPPMLSRLIAGGALGLNLATAKSLVWAVWAAFSPLSLRAAMRARLRYRNMRAARRGLAVGARSWQPAPAPHSSRTNPNRPKSPPVSAQDLLPVACVRGASAASRA
ncbi:MAG: glycosyltransferase family 2 protein [Alphaproteobacteria bacterium]|nr:glycosyltransferase family 2 protein [Alphaproteobacteria bacterium]